jgi:large subunit ribosomal protein L31
MGYLKNLPPYGFKKYIVLRTQDVRQKANIMKKDLHTEFVTCTVTCACGNTFENKAAQDTLKIDICNECHPFFTGSERMVDTAGRIEKFNARYAKK